MPKGGYWGIIQSLTGGGKKPVEDEMETRRKLLMKKKQSGGMLDTAFGRRRDMEDALSNIE